jgi:hypothetical protein
MERPMGLTLSQELSACVAGASTLERDNRVLTDIVMGIAARHDNVCVCDACGWANRFPEWIARLRRERNKDEN